MSIGSSDPRRCAAGERDAFPQGSNPTFGRWWCCAASGRPESAGWSTAPSRSGPSAILRASKGRIESGSSGLSMFAGDSRSDLTVRPVDHGMAVRSHEDRDDLVNPQQFSLGKIGWIHSLSQGAIPVFLSR